MGFLYNQLNISLLNIFNQFNIILRPFKGFNIKYDTVTDCAEWLSSFSFIIKGQTTHGNQDLRSWMIVFNPLFYFI